MHFQCVVQRVHTFRVSEALASYSLRSYAYTGVALMSRMALCMHTQALRTCVCRTLMSYIFLLGKLTWLFPGKMCCSVGPLSFDHWACHAS